MSIKLDEFKPELEPGPSSPPPAAQARKSDRACDFCRRRKTRCDGAPKPNSKCSNCKRNQCPCTYLEASRPRGPPKAYVTALEDRIERFERLFKRLRPEADFSDVLGRPIPRGSWRSDHERDAGSSNRPEDASGSSSRQPTPSQSLHIPSHASLLPHSAVEHKHHQGHLSDDGSISSDEEFSVANWSRQRLTVRGRSHVSASDPDSPAGTGTGSGDSPMQDVYTSGTVSSFSIGADESSLRFHGKSSFLPLVHLTRRYMRATTGNDGFREPRENPEDTFSDSRRAGIDTVPKGRRRLYWGSTPWEEAWEHKRSPFSSGSSPLSSTSHKLTNPVFDFPPSDLTLPLLALYFHHTNTIFPLLHAPTFYAQFRDGLHTRDSGFAGVVWAVMAVAARWSEDQRVLWNGWGSEIAGGLPEVEDPTTGDLEWASAGWRFFLRSLDGPSFTVTSLDPPSLFDLQFCSLGAMFLRGSSIGPAGWVVIGTGLRKAMDVGAHRRKVYTSKPSVENELWKRAFWMLVLFDQIGSTSLGRPCCVREEDFDLELPLEVDDEYWTPSDPSQPAFKQPAGKPSMVSGFISMLKLTQIMAHALRTIYCIDKSKVLLGLVSNDWQEQIVSQLNTALDEWVESVPEHLRWSSGIEDDVFSNQSATIYTTYYLTLILIYRPFSQASSLIPQPNQDVPARPSKTFPFPADSICTNAAHSAIRIVDAQTRRGLSNIPNMISVAHMAAVTQLMSMQAQVLSSHDADLGALSRECDRYMQDVEKCIRCLDLAQSRWIMARKFLTYISSSLPEPGFLLSIGPKEKPIGSFASQQGSEFDDNLEICPVQIGSSLPTMPSNSWTPSPVSVRPQSRMSEAEQALTSQANWRWFHENEKFAQRRMQGLQKTGDPLRHHIIVPSSQSQMDIHELRSNESRSRESPAPGIQLSAPVPPIRNMHPVMSLSAQVGMNSLAPVARPEIGRRFSIHASTPPPIIPDQPISSTSRAVRASTSGQFLSVTVPQSAARDEYGGWDMNAQQQQTTMRVPSHPYATLHQQSPHVQTHR